MLCTLGRFGYNCRYNALVRKSDEGIRLTTNQVIICQPYLSLPLASYTNLKVSQTCSTAIKKQMVLNTVQEKEINKIINCSSGSVV